MPNGGPPDTLPGNFFDKKAASPAPDTLPGDFFDKSTRPAVMPREINTQGGFAPVTPIVPKGVPTAPPFGDAHFDVNPDGTVKATSPTLGTFAGPKDHVIDSLKIARGLTSLGYPHYQIHRAGSGYQVVTANGTFTGDPGSIVAQAKGAKGKGGTFPGFTPNRTAAQVFAPQPKAPTMQDTIGKTLGVTIPKQKPSAITRQEYEYVTKPGFLEPFARHAVQLGANPTDVQLRTEDIKAGRYKIRHGGQAGSPYEDLIPRPQTAKGTPGLQSAPGELEQAVFRKHLKDASVTDLLGYMFLGNRPKGVSQNDQRAFQAAATDAFTSKVAAGHDFGQGVLTIPATMAADLLQNTRNLAHSTSPEDAARSFANMMLYVLPEEGAIEKAVGKGAVRGLPIGDLHKLAKSVLDKSPVGDLIRANPKRFDAALDNIGLDPTRAARLKEIAAVEVPKTEAPTVTEAAPKSAPQPKAKTVKPPKPEPIAEPKPSAEPAATELPTEIPTEPAAKKPSARQRVYLGSSRTIEQMRTGEKGVKPVMFFTSSDPNIAAGYAHGAGGVRTPTDPWIVDSQHSVRKGDQWEFPAYERAEDGTWKHIGYANQEGTRLVRRASELPPIPHEEVQSTVQGMMGSWRFHGINPNAMLHAADVPKGRILDLTGKEGIDVLRKVDPSLITNEGLSGEHFSWSSTKYANMTGSVDNARWQKAIPKLKKLGYSGVSFIDDVPGFLPKESQTTIALFSEPDWVSTEKLSEPPSPAKKPRAPYSRKTTDTQGRPVTETRLKTDSIGVEPGMQYKRGATKEGVTGEVAPGTDVEAQGPITVWEKADGQIKVIDGHNRLAEAKAQGKKTMPVRIYREADGVSFEDAKQIGREINRGQEAKAPEGAKEPDLAPKLESPKAAPRTRADIQSDIAAKIAAFKKSQSLGTLGGEKLSLAIEIGGHYVELGIHDFKAWSARMVKDLGDEVKPHLEEIWSKVRPHGDVGRILPSNERSRVSLLSRDSGWGRLYDDLLSESQAVRGNAYRSLSERVRDFADANGLDTESVWRQYLQGQGKVREVEAGSPVVRFTGEGGRGAAEDTTLSGDKGKAGASAISIPSTQDEARAWAEGRDASRAKGSESRTSKPTEGTKRKEKINASEIESTKEVHGSLRALPGESEGQVPAEIGSKGVQQDEGKGPTGARQAKTEGQGQKEGVAGVAHEVLEKRDLNVLRAQGTTPEKMVEIGRKHEHEAEQRIKRFEDDPEKRINEVDVASFRARDEELAREYQKAIARNAGPGANKATHDAVQSAFKAMQDWAERIKPALSKFEPIGKAMQGQTRLDTGSWEALAGKAAEVRGGDGIPTPYEIGQAKRLAGEVNDWKQKFNDLNAKIESMLEARRAVARGRGVAEGKVMPKTNKERAAWIKARQEAGTLYHTAGVKQTETRGAVSVAPRQLHPDVVRVVWDHAKENYIDPRTEAGLETQPLDITDVIDRTAHDLGLDPSEVAEALAGKKSPVRQHIDAAYRIASERRKAVRSAEDFVAFAKEPRALKVMKAIGSHLDPRGIAVMGHGTVGMFTHAGTVAFSPRDWGAWGRNFMRQLPMVYDKGVHEKLMGWLERHPQYDEMRRNGLEVDVNSKADYQKYALSRENLIHRAELRAKAFAAKGGGRQIVGAPAGKVLEYLGGGNRGFDALKLLRAEMYTSYMTGVPSELRGDVGKMMAEMINSATGAGNRKIPGGSKIMFAPSLEVSRWERTVIDPATTIKTAAKAWGSRVGLAVPPTPAEVWMAKFRAKRAAWLIGTYASALGVNYGLNKAFGVKDEDNVNFTEPLRADWFRFKVDGRTLDPTGGVVQPIRLIAALGEIGIADPTKFQVQTGDTRKRQFEEQVGRYIVSKLSPTYGVPIEAGIFKQDFMGRPLPNASKLEIEKALKSKYPKQPYKDWWEYAATKGPIPVVDIMSAFNEGTAQSGVPESFSHKLFKDILTVGGAFSGVRESPSTPMKPKVVPLSQYSPELKKAFESYSYTPSPVQQKQLGETDEHFAARSQAIAKAQEDAWPRLKAMLDREKSATQRGIIFKRVMEQASRAASARADADLRAKKARETQEKVRRERVGAG